ncbi:MAG TPA: hypothetical protein VGK73_31705 [Polyangiaceae bacterium]
MMITSGVISLAIALGRFGAWIRQRRQARKRGEQVKPVNVERAVEEAADALEMIEDVVTPMQRPSAKHRGLK